MKSVIHWFLKPYPFLENKPSKWLLIISFTIFVPLFLLIYKPFGIEEVENEFRLFYILGFGVCVGMVLVINYFFIPNLFPKIYNPDKWNIWKEFLFILSSFFLTACVNYIYNTIMSNLISEYISFIGFLGMTFSIGIFPIIIMLILVERQLSKRNEENAHVFRNYLSKKIIKKENKIKIIITSEGLKADTIHLRSDDFIYASSDNNYVTLYYLIDGELNRKLLRLTLKKLESQLSKAKNMIRCHRSFLVNKDKIIQIQGNARSLVLKLENLDDLIPVSRSFPKEKLK